MLIDQDVWVTLRYRLFDSSGEAIETGQRELTYLHGGYGAVFDRIEATLTGRELGFETSVYLQPDESFGDYEPELVRLAPRDAFPADLEEGMTFEGVPGEEADGLLYIVTDFTEQSVVLDANHPLAGMSVRFDLEVTDLRDASAEEIEAERIRAGFEEGT